MYSPSEKNWNLSKSSSLSNLACDKDILPGPENDQKKKDRQHHDQKKKDRQYNDQKKKDRQYNDQKKKDRQHNDQKKKDRQRSTKH
jgi:hypothetical protein